MKGKKIKRIAFITGCAGFIGFHLSQLLLANNWKIIGLDGFTDYYDINLKKERFRILKTDEKFIGFKGLIQNQNLLDNIYKRHKPNIIIHLAAQPGVRYSIKNPQTYLDNNVVGTFNLFEIAKKYKPEHFLIASTSSVYGNNKKLPFTENHKTNHPISLYAASKKSNEIMAHAYSHLFGIPITIFRFFTVYGPWGRPDMALFKFTRKIISGEPINLYNNGNMKRDFTNIYDLVDAIKLLIDVIPKKPEVRFKKIKNDNLSETAPYRIVNIGNSSSVNLLSYVEEIEKAIGKKAVKNFVAMQEGDIIETHSNIDLLKELTGFKPYRELRKSIVEFVNWYRSYYEV